METLQLHQLRAPSLWRTREERRPSAHPAPLQVGALRNTHRSFGGPSGLKISLAPRESALGSGCCSRLGAPASPGAAGSGSGSPAVVLVPPVEATGASARSAWHISHCKAGVARRDGAVPGTGTRGEGVRESCGTLQSAIPCRTPHTASKVLKVSPCS